MFTNMKNGARLPNFLVFLLVGLSVIGWAGVITVVDNKDQTYESRLIPLTQLNSIYTANLNNRLTISKAIYQPENMAEYIQEITKNKELIDEQWGIFTRVAQDGMLADEEGKILASRFAELRERFVEEGIKPALAAMHANNPVKLKRIQEAYIEPLNTPLNESLNALINKQIRIAKKDV